MEEDEDLFKQLAEDKDIAAAIADHEQACKVKESDCPACRFYANIHEIRHFADMVDAAKAVDMSAYPFDFVTDAQVIIQFLSEASRYFMESMEWEEDEDELEEEEGDDE